MSNVPTFLIQILAGVALGEAIMYCVYLARGCYPRQVRERRAIEDMVDFLAFATLAGISLYYAFV